VPKKLELPKGKIGPNFTKKVLPWVELFWHSHKRYPTDTELATEFGFTAEDLQHLHASKYYLLCLKDRGISHQPGNFTEQQVAAISLITNFHDTRPVNAKLAGIGVTSEMYNGWQQDPAFKRELQNRADDILENIYPEAQAQLGKMVKNGNFNALKFYFEITGRTQSPETVNVKMMMMKVIEAVQKHVKDPVILAAIAEEIHGAAAPVASITTAPIPAINSPLRGQFEKHLEDVRSI
jgi:hypothetical protein